MQPIAAKIANQGLITAQDARQRYRSNDLNALGIMASAVRERKNGNVATYILNRYINYSNICVLSCQFCAFAAKKRDAHAFESSIEEIVGVVQGALASGITEVHMVGGLHPTLGKGWYIDLLSRLRALDPALQLKAFTAIEIRHLARRIFKTSIADTLDPQVVHLNARDVTLICSSRDPLEKLLASRNRMARRFNWASTDRSGVRRDLGVARTA